MYYPPNIVESTHQTHSLYPEGVTPTHSPTDLSVPLAEEILGIPLSTGHGAGRRGERRSWTAIVEDDPDDEDNQKQLHQCNV